MESRELRQEIEQVKLDISNSRLKLGLLLVNNDFINTYKESYINQYIDLYKIYIQTENLLK